MNPIEMSKEVLSAISHSYELATYSTPELRGLFNDWLGEIEREVLEFLKEKNRVDPNEVAQQLKLKRESVIFILSKLAREGKINMQASGTEES
ncbi:MAG: winged helix-turn-helix domain-containing protein [Desulfobacterales bacterium]|nr:winged helix-turn-helix domain-containing protein [Desulfobacterales bacterium]